MPGERSEPVVGILDGGLSAVAESLWPPLGLLDGCAERLGRLGVPVAQVYVRAAETSLFHAIMAIERVRVGEGWTPSDDQPGIDPRLLEWLD